MCNYACGDVVVIVIAIKPSPDIMSVLTLLDFMGELSQLLLYAVGVKEGAGLFVQFCFLKQSRILSQISLRQRVGKVLVHQLVVAFVATFDQVGECLVYSPGEMMWGVTPWRVEYLQKVYDIKPEHTGLLVMGGDEQFVDFERKGRIKEEVRKRYGIPKTDFLVVTGGKIDKTKNIHLLIDAFKQIDKNISLLVFGKINEEMSNLAEEDK